MRTVLLDRDGVICEDRSHMRRKEQIELLPQVAEAIALLNKNECLVIVVSNQAAVARGACSIDEVEEMNAHFVKLLESRVAKIDGICFCSHHPTAGDNRTYTRVCECRKPNIGMILEAQRDFGFRIDRSYLVGDKTSDILAGKNAGCKTILVCTGYGGSDKIYDVKQDFTEKNLYDVVINVILPER